MITSNVCGLVKSNSLPLPSRKGDDVPRFGNHQGKLKALNKIGNSFQMLGAPSVEQNRSHRSEDNGYVTNRYAAPFQNGILSGWEGIAPGVNSSSPKSMILHLQEIFKFLNLEGVTEKEREEVNA